MIIMQSAQRVIAQSIDMVGGADFGSEYSSYSTHVGARAPSASHQGRDVGIEGMKGVSGTKKDGSRIGADFIRMQPGAKFEPHIHEGDHEIYFISGAGFVHINGEDVVVTAGHLIHIPGEYTHGVWVGPDATEPLIFTAIGHPHKHVHARDRMQHPTDHEH